LGAQAFVDHHRWSKQIGLILNYEARGSSGQSYILIETNVENRKLLTAFSASKPNFPTANYLMFSIYKKLSNNIDLTIFHENENISGFNFAFIGDHLDYHIAKDSYERLNKTSLLHQADYFTTSLNYFSNLNITNLHYDEDFVFLNFPFIKLLSDPFS
jgi:hypothetical protein